MTVLVNLRYGALKGSGSDIVFFTVKYNEEQTEYGS